MKELNEEQIVKKWGPIIDTLNFKAENRAKACKYAELHALFEAEAATTLYKYPEMRTSTIDNPPFTENLLPISLKVLEGIRDLSKIHFISQPVFMITRDGNPQPESVGAHQISIGINHEDYMDISRKHGIDVLNTLESAIIHEMSARINQLIEEGNKIYIFLVIAGMRMISEGKEGMNPQVSIYGRWHIESPTISIEDL